jgi:hypothetical protein
MMKIILIVFAFYSMAFAGRPLKSVDAFPLGKNLFQIEFASDTYYSDNKYSLMMPAVITYGAGNYTDIQMGISFHPSKGRPVESFDLGFKQFLYGTDLFETSVASGLTSDINNISLQSTAGYLNLILSLKLEPFTLHYNAGYSNDFNEWDSHEFYASAGGEYLLTERIILAADAGFSSNKIFDSGQFHYYSLIGFSYLVLDNFSIDTGLNFCYKQKLVDLVTFGTTVKL